MKAWHFTRDVLLDGSPVPPIGEWLEYSGPLRMCRSGLHASKEPFNALQYAPGPHLHLVEVGGNVIEGGDKLVCSRRKIIASMDATEMLHYYARMHALSVVHLWNAPDVVLDYLMTGEENIKAAARSAARSAALAAWDATARVAWDDPRSARSAAWAAWDAAWATRDTAWEVACATELDATRQEFNTLVYECFEGAI